MALDLKRIIDEVEHPRKRGAISAAIAQQDWIKFHTETSLDAVNSIPFARFKTFVKSLLPDDKYLTTINLLKFPIPTNRVTESIFVEVGKDI